MCFGDWTAGCIQKMLLGCLSTYDLAFDFFSHNQFILRLFIGEMLNLSLFHDETC